MYLLKNFNQRSIIIYSFNLPIIIDFDEVIKIIKTIQFNYTVIAD